MNWQPIETAPRDGSLFLIVNSKDTESYTLAWWVNDERPCSYYKGFTIYERGNDGIEDYTHWMPVPPLPKENAND